MLSIGWLGYTPWLAIHQKQYKSQRVIRGTQVIQLQQTMFFLKQKNEVQYLTLFLLS